jgi:hypothetical protein
MSDTIPPKLPDICPILNRPPARGLAVRQVNPRHLLGEHVDALGVHGAATAKPQNFGVNLLELHQVAQQHATTPLGKAADLLLEPRRNGALVRQLGLHILRLPTNAPRFSGPARRARPARDESLCVSSRCLATFTNAVLGMTGQPHRGFFERL